MYEFSEAIFRTGRAFSFLLFTFLFVGIVGQLGEPIPKDVENTVTRDSNYNSGNGLKQQDKEESNDKKVWISDANEGEQSSQSPPLKPIVIENTFIACVNDSSILKNATYLNLTQVLENERFKWGDTETSACFMFCKNSAPSDFISVQKAFGYSTQSCGCHSDIEGSLDAKQDESKCEDSPGFMKLYCGPSNLDCLNASQKLRNSLIKTLGILTLLYLTKTLLIC